jgi:hypothetical protein
MFKFNITSKETSYGELSSWFVAREAKYEFSFIDINDWMNNKSYHLYDITIYDEHVAVEFRLTFGANVGESHRHHAFDLETELAAAMSEDIAKAIDEEIYQELLAACAQKQ